ncbi:GNAT family N-acetyltransferase [Halonatronum saccharophilum]|uniref:GNAT family N-acetyltransferase n=1 Tax=Halonatronum saccharophilum TaxID=150060 RepID=UPI00048846A9|nr:GNAT family N-acetyltransferase [Halonatronum saccharophilum]
MQQFVYVNEGRVLLREATKDDILSIYEMYEGSDSNLWWSNEELNRFRFNLVKEAKGKVFVAVLNDEIIGHTEIILPKSKEDSVYLLKLEIHDDYRRRKFGIELVRYSVIVMKNLGYQSCITWPDTNKSKGLYKKVGLKEVGENPQLDVKIVGKGDTKVKFIEELGSKEKPKDLEMVVGCPWARDYIWLKAFKTAEEGLLNYKGPYVHLVKIENIKAVTLVDGDSLYIYLPKGSVADVDLIRELLTYSSNLALDKGIDVLNINIKSDIWKKIGSPDFWEVEEEKRLEMKMDFT